MYYKWPNPFLLAVAPELGRWGNGYMTIAPNGYLGQAFAYKARPPQPDKVRSLSPFSSIKKGSIKSPHFSFVSKAPFALSVSKVRILFILYILDQSRSAHCIGRSNQ